MKRFLIFAYGVTSYSLSVATLMYTAAFLINVGVPKSVDSAPEVPFMTALVTNIALLALFSLQHSVMARPTFKRWWTGIVPEPAERSTYMLFSSAALVVLFVFWQPMGVVMWNFDVPVVRSMAYGVFALGWAVLLLASFLINHFDLFGLRQVWLQLLGRPYEPLPFKVTALYRYVRHPIYLGWLLIFWATPTMTVAHLVFAVATSIYIPIAIWFEERNLVAAHPEYEGYRRQVPMLLPSMKRRDRIGGSVAAR
jgi:protein-S-isoprenylcysteine O-methyltransferase Ste14